MSWFFISLPKMPSEIPKTIRQAAIKGNLVATEVKTDVPKLFEQILKKKPSSPVVSEWPTTTSKVFKILLSNFIFVGLTNDEDEILQKFRESEVHLKTLASRVKDSQSPKDNRPNLKFGPPSTMQIVGRNQQSALHIMHLLRRSPAISSARLTEVGGSFMKPSGAHLLWQNPAYEKRQREEGITAPVCLDRGIITFDLNMTESLILFHKFSTLPHQIKRIWLKVFERYFALSTTWGVAQMVLTGLKNFRDVRKYAARFESFIDFLQNQYYIHNTDSLRDLIKNLEPNAVTGWINLMIADKKVSTIRGYIAAVNYFLKRLHLPLLQEINPAINCVIEGWRKLLAEEEGEGATLALSWPQMVEVFALAKQFFQNPKKFSPTCYSALIISFWNALRTGEARELTFLQCVLLKDSHNIENLITTLWDPKTGKRRRRHQHIFLSDVAEQDHAFCPLLHLKRALRLRLKNQICLFADQEGLPFRESEFYTIWRTFFKIVREKLQLGQGQYSFYTFRSSSITNYSVNFHMNERDIKAISRHTEKSQVLKGHYLIKDTISSKWQAARGWAQRFKTEEAYNLNCTKFDDFFEFSEWFECGQ